jgi:hypothetical protein
MRAIQKDGASIAQGLAYKHGAGGSLDVTRIAYNQAILAIIIKRKVITNTNLQAKLLQAGMNGTCHFSLTCQDDDLFDLHRTSELSSLALF